MTTGDEEAESLADNLFREVDDQFKDLEREYSQARQDLAAVDSDRRDTPDGALEASHERYELMSQVATLDAEVSRQADELDERDRMLRELGDKIAGFEADIVQRDEMLNELHEAKQEALEERREQARVSALLDARAAERQELADVALRLQNERDNVQELLATALTRYDQVEAERVQMDDKVRLLEAARDTAAHEHDVRAHELIESRAEMSKLVDQIDELSRTAATSDESAKKAEALAERRTNEAGYLNRRIEALDEKLVAATTFEAEATNLRRELTMAGRRVTELERELATQQSETSAAKAAVDAIAERTSDYDEIVARIAQVEEERDAAWEAASGHPAEPVAPPVVLEPAADEAASLADRARELGARRSNEAELAAQAAESAAAQVVASAESEVAPAAELASEPRDQSPRGAETEQDHQTQDQEAQDTGFEDTGLEDAGFEDTGFEDTGLEDTGLEDTGLEDTGLEDLDDDDVEFIESDLAALVADPDLEHPAGVSDRVRRHRDRIA